MKQLLQDSRTAETGSEESDNSEKRSRKKSNSHRHIVTAQEARQTKQSKEEKRQGPELTTHRAFRSIKLRLRWRPTVSGRKTVPEAPQVRAHADCFWPRPNCYLLLTMEKQQGVCLGKTARCQRTESLLLSILTLRSKRTTTENHPTPSLTKLGIHSIMDEKILNCSAKQILLPGSSGIRAKWDHKLTWYRFLKPLVEITDRHLDVKSWIHRPLPGRGQDFLPKAALKGFFQHQQGRDNWNSVRIL